jgi:ClpP class serine protease
MWSGNRAYTDTQRAAVSGMLDQIYVAFTQRVANGRQLPLATVENIAQGRVWTGRQALDHKLVDGIGGLRQALDDVAIKLGVGDASALNVVQFSQVSDPFQEIRSVLLGGLRMFSSVSPFLREMSFLHDPSRAVVYAPDFAIID